MAVDLAEHDLLLSERLVSSIRDRSNKLRGTSPLKDRQLPNELCMSATSTGTFSTVGSPGRHSASTMA